MDEQLPISHEVQLRLMYHATCIAGFQPFSSIARTQSWRFSYFNRETLLFHHRCIPPVDAGIWICSVSSNPTYSLFEGPKVKYYASCWNQLVVCLVIFMWKARTKLYCWCSMILIIRNGRKLNRQQPHRIDEGCGDRVVPEVRHIRLFKCQRSVARIKHLSARTAGVTTHNRGDARHTRQKRTLQAP